MYHDSQGREIEDIEAENEARDHIHLDHQKGNVNKMPNYDQPPHFPKYTLQYLGFAPLSAAAQVEPITLTYAEWEAICAIVQDLAGIAESVAPRSVFTSVIDGHAIAESVGNAVSLKDKCKL